MKTRVTAPAVALVLALLAGCGGGGGGSSPAAEPPPAETPEPPPPPPPAITVANSVQRVKDSMTGAHEASSPELTAPAYYLTGPALQQRVTPAGTKALGGFGQIYVATGNAAANTRVQLRNFETYVRTKAGVWKRVQYSEKVVGEFYTANYAAFVSKPTLRAEAEGGGVSVKPVSGQIFRFWPESGITRSLVLQTGTDGDVNDVDAVFTTVQARLIKDVSAGVDDRSSARYLVNTAADWWTSAAQVPQNRNFIGNVQVGNGKLHLAINEWQAMNFHSASSAAHVEALATPLPGGTAPIANSTPLNAGVAKRVILVGDSITQGGGGNDSFRRELWNRIVSDPTNPLVDFVGTRSGTTTDVVASCVSAAPNDAGGYALPEFDRDHQAYWGRCTEQVAGQMISAVNTLASQQRKPDIALIHLGTNDLNQQQEQEGVDIAAEIATVVANLRVNNAGLKALVAKILPFGTTPVAEAKIPDLHTEIDRLSGVTVVDLNSGFIVGTDTDDGIHPNATGEAKVAASWLPALKAALQ